eukprot:m.21131 g.21131  ORF g.21131 m.21131 type:complete len:81 (-) comp8684_c0_seq1:153-395(-)
MSLFSTIRYSFPSNSEYDGVVSLLTIGTEDTPEKLNTANTTTRDRRPNKEQNTILSFQVIAGWSCAIHSNTERQSNQQGQ